MNRINTLMTLVDSQSSGVWYWWPRTVYRKTFLECSLKESEWGREAALLVNFWVISSLSSFISFSTSASCQSCEMPEFYSYITLSFFMSTCSKNKYEYGELATRNTQGCSGSGKDPGFNPGKAGLDLFRRPSLLSCFKSVYLICECVITDGFLIDKVLTLASRLLKNMLFKITNSRRLQIGTVRFYLFVF